MIYGYIRVSSDKQTVENQRFEISKFCERGGLAIDGWIEETISGTKAYNKRELGNLNGEARRDSRRLPDGGRARADGRADTTFKWSQGDFVVHKRYL